MNIEPVSSKYKSFLTDESHILGEAEEIVFPKSKCEVVEIIKKCQNENKKITFQGGRTGLKGGSVPFNSLIVNLGLINNIGDVKIFGDKGEITVGSGAVLGDIHKSVNCKGFRFTVNPTESTATAGGMFSTNAEGLNSLYYSRFSKCVKSIGFTDLNGENYIINRGDYSVKNGELTLPCGDKLNFNSLSSNLPIDFFEEGMDLIDFLSGKEGKLGAVTSLTLEIEKAPKDVWGVLFFFKNTESVINFSNNLKNYKNKNIRLTTAEYFSENALNIIKDNPQNQFVAKLPKMPINAKEAVYIEIESDDEDLSAEALMDLIEFFESSGGDEEETWAQNSENQIKSIREMRHAVVSILNENSKIHIADMGFRYETDLYVKNKGFDEYLKIYKETLNKYSLKGAVYGSILKNHLHLAFLSENKNDKIKIETAIKELSQKAVCDGGKIFSKYGVGKENKKLLDSILKDEDKAIIKAIVKVFDSRFIGDY